jgi:alkylhydroperoxidase family enzyme
VDQVKSGQHLDDKRADALVTFVRELVKSRGLVGDDVIASFLSQGFEERHVLEVIVAIAMKTISNYSNHIAHTPIDEVFGG